MSFPQITEIVRYLYSGWPALGYRSLILSVQNVREGSSEKSIPRLCFLVCGVLCPRLRENLRGCAVANVWAASSYWAGRTGGRAQTDAGRRKLGQYLFLRYGGKIIFFAQFVPVLRTL